MDNVFLKFLVARLTGICFADTSLSSPSGNATSSANHSSASSSKAAPSKSGSSRTSEKVCLSLSLRSCGYFFGHRPNSFLTDRKKIKSIRSQCQKSSVNAVATSFILSRDKWPKCLSERKPAAWCLSAARMMVGLAYLALRPIFEATMEEMCRKSLWPNQRVLVDFTFLQILWLFLLQYYIPPL